MKLTNVLMALTASAMLMTGCTSQKDPAENAVTQAEAAMTDLRVDAAKFAPEELKTTETTLAKMKDDLAKQDYKHVVAGVPQFNKEIATLKEVLVGRQTQIIAATREWETLNAEVPKAVEEIQVRVDSLASSPKLPKEVDEGEPRDHEERLGRGHCGVQRGQCNRSCGQGALGAGQGRRDQRTARDEPHVIVNSPGAPNAPGFSGCRLHRSVMQRRDWATARSPIRRRNRGVVAGRGPARSRTS
jgi:hypothetical protein